MRASHVPSAGVIGVADWPDPSPAREGQFVVRMDWASICGSDLHAVHGGRMNPLGPQADAFVRCVHAHYSVSAQTEPGLASFHEALRRIAADEVRVDHCVGPVFELEEIADALRCAQRQGDGAVKITVRIAGR